LLCLPQALFLLLQILDLPFTRAIETLNSAAIIVAALAKTAGQGQAEGHRLTVTGTLVGDAAVSATRP